VTGSDEEFLSLPLLRSIPEAERRQGTGRVGRRPSSSVRTRAFSSSQACHGGIAAKWQLLLSMKSISLVAALGAVACLAFSTGT
jgi:hypothetical protein